MKVEVLRNVFQRNQAAADENRALLRRHGLTCINMLGGAGCGKTSLLEAVIPLLRDRGIRLAVLEGDLATSLDAERVAALDVPAVQLMTDGGCHLTATLVQQGLARLPLDRLDLVIVENVGNPICPANFDLGEHLRIVVLSVAEGHDKVAKYPLLFRGAGAVVIAKWDLLAYSNFQMDRVAADLRHVSPDADVIVTSTRPPLRISELTEWMVRGVAPATALAG